MAEESKPKRLCSEIKLFDLCSRETCKCKDGRYCTDSEMLAKFEAISEEDEQERDRFLAADEEAAGEEADFDETDYDECDEEPYPLYDNEYEDEEDEQE